MSERTICEPIDAVASDLEANGFSVRTIEQMPDAAYRAWPAWSVSQFKMLPDEPELFWGRYVAKLPDYQMKPSPQMALGTAVHECLLQGIEPNVIPDSVLSKSGSKAGGAWKEFAAEHAGETWLKAEEAEPIKRCIASVMDNRKARALLELPGDNELAIFWRDEYTGLTLKGRMDRLIRVGNGLVLDLKTANDPTETGFPFACLDRKYHIQAATYSEAAQYALGQPPEGFLFIAVQVEAPYICQVYTCAQEMLNLGYTREREALTDLDQRLKDGNWHRSGHGLVNRLDLPKRAYQQF